MSQQKHWFPGQPAHRNIFYFTQSTLEIREMPEAFISQDEQFMGNTYESDDGEEQYHIIGRNLVDGFYKELLGSENLLDNTPAEPANCSFTQGTHWDETCSLFITRDDSLIRIGLRRGQVIRTEKIKTSLPVAAFSPVVSFMVMDKLIIGYVCQVSAEHGDYALVFLQYKNGTTSVHQLKIFNTEDALAQCYIHINKNQYALILGDQKGAGTVIHTGEIDENGQLGPFLHTIKSNSTFISAAFSRENTHLFYPYQDDGTHFICALNFSDNSVTRHKVIEDYNMLKLAPDDKIYGLGKYIENESQKNIRLCSAIEILPDSSVEIKEFIAAFNGGYFPADTSPVISA